MKRSTSSSYQAPFEHVKRSRVSLSAAWPSRADGVGNSDGKGLFRYWYASRTANSGRPTGKRRDQGRARLVDRKAPFVWVYRLASGTTIFNLHRLSEVECGLGRQ